VLGGRSMLTRNYGPPDPQRRTRRRKLYSRSRWWLVTGCVAASACVGPNEVEDRSKENGVPGFSPRLEPRVNVGCCGGRSTPSADEPEILAAADTPRASANYVFALNPTRGSVAVVHAKTLGIQVVEAGDFPTFLRASQTDDAAIALNVGSNEATLIRIPLASSPRAFGAELSPVGQCQAAGAHRESASIRTLRRLSIAWWRASCCSPRKNPTRTTHRTTLVLGSLQMEGSRWEEH